MIHLHLAVINFVFKPKTQKSMQRDLLLIFFSSIRGRRTDILLKSMMIILIIVFFGSPVLADENSRSDVNRDTVSQQTTVSGTVIDQAGQPLAGVTVLVKGTTIGTLTSPSGKYSLPNVPPNSTLQFSFIGMTAQEVVLRAGQSTVDIVMKELMTALEEVVVIGYGQQKRESVVAAIAQTTSEDIQRAGNVTDLSQAITGHLPGVVTVTSATEPGGVNRGTSGTEIYIRGRNTWNGGQALVLVDGVERSMDQLDMSEVENISVLKDASATAVFGVKGANGVILITTKRGATGKPKISFNYNTTAQLLSRLPQWMDSFDAMMARNESIERELPYSEASWGDYLPYDFVKKYNKQYQAPGEENIYFNTDWVNSQFADAAFSHRASLNLQGGTRFVSYFGTLAYLHEGDMFRNYDNHKGYDASYAYDRFNFRSNLDFKITQTTTLKVNLAGYYGKKDSSWDNEGFTGWDANSWFWIAAYGYDPSLYPAQYANGNWGFSPNISQYTMNPVASLNNLGIRMNHTMQLNSDFALEQDLGFVTKGLTAKIAVYYDNQVIAQDGIFDQTNHIRATGGNLNLQFVDPMKYYENPNRPESEYINYYPTSGLGFYDFVVRPWSLRSEVIAGADWVWRVPVDRRTQIQAGLNYSRRFGLHNVAAMALFKREKAAYGSDFPYFREDWISRITYDYDTRYLFEINGAYNGSEQFGPGYRFAFFPSVAAGWIVSNEKFFPIEWMNRLKLRYSIGKVGDDKVSGGRWLYSSQYSYGGATRLSPLDNYGYSPYTWYKESTIGNPDIRWEKAIKNNYGIEMGLFKDLISINFEYFTEDRSDILIDGGSRNIPPFFGANPGAANLGKVESRGHEIEVRLDKRWGQGFHLWSNIAITHTENEVIFRDDPELLDAYRKSENFQIGQFRTQLRTPGYMDNWDDIYASTPLESNDIQKFPGWVGLIDFNSDGIIKSEDSAPAHYSDRPMNTFNYSVGGDYKGLSLMLQFYGVNNVSRNMSLSTFGGRLNIYPMASADYYSKDNTDAVTYLNKWRATGTGTADRWIWDASYFRLKTAELAYTFQGGLLKKTGLSNMRIYLNGMNLFLWSDLPDDREGTNLGNTGGSGGPGSGGASAGAYPNTRRVNLGVEVTF